MSAIGEGFRDISADKCSSATSINLPTSRRGCTASSTFLDRIESKWWFDSQTGIGWCCRCTGSLAFFVFVQLLCCGLASKLSIIATHERQASMEQKLLQHHQAGYHEYSGNRRAEEDQSRIIIRTIGAERYEYANILLRLLT